MTLANLWLLKMYINANYNLVKVKDHLVNDSFTV